MSQILNSEDEITGPSSEPTPPLITAGVIAAPVIRTGFQGGAATFIVQGIEAFNFYAFTDSQRSWSIVALTIFVAFAQNTIEKIKGRRLLGVASDSKRITVRSKVKKRVNKSTPRSKVKKRVNKSNGIEDYKEQKKPNSS